LLVFAGDDGSWQGEPSAGQTIYVATAFALSQEPTKGDEFAKKYRETNRRAPDVHAALAYDNVRLMVEALKAGQSAAPEKIREELLKIKDFPGLTGPLSFTREQHLQRPAFVARVLGPGRIPVVERTFQPH
jgi:branched-chain amino acid transport system substrate-binding protein